MDRIEELAAQVELLLRAIEGIKRLPTLLTYRMAAKELSIGLTKFRELVDEGAVITVEVGGRKMVPAGEVLKFGEARRPRGRGRQPSLSEGDKVRARLKARRKR